MVGNISNPRALRSRLALLDAAYGLIAARGVSAISITDVAAEAGVTRPTFYQYFKDIRELAQQAALERVQVDLPPLPTLSADAMRRLLPEERRSHISSRAEPVLRHLEAHRRFYLAVFDEAGDLGFYAAIASFISTRIYDLPLDPALADSGQIDSRDRARFMTHGILWTVITWLKSDFCGDNGVSRMAQRLASVVVGAAPTET